MNWDIQYSDTAEKQLSKLDKSVQKKVVTYLEDLATLQDPAERGHPLTGPLAGCQTYRIGQLRAIIKIYRSTIIIAVLTIDRRDSIY
jgi:mRNA interferase RelE/StbE